jgi:mono/diheme cytochrome c family protein
MRFLRDALITFGALVAIAWIVAYARVRAGLAADAEPGTVERAIASRLVRLSIPADVKQRNNPFRTDGTVWQAAADYYGDHCAACHGSDGHGQTVLGQNMYPKTPDLADPAVQRFSDGELFYVIQNGVRWTGMPAWKREYSPDETWRLVSLIRAVPHLARGALESAALGAEPETTAHHLHQTPEDGAETDHSKH